MATQKTPVVGRKPGSLEPVKTRSIPAPAVPQLRAINDDRRPGAPDSLNTGYAKVRYLKKSPVR